MRILANLGRQTRATPVVLVTTRLADHPAQQLATARALFCWSGFSRDAPGLAVGNSIATEDTPTTVLSKTTPAGCDFRRSGFNCVNQSVPSAIVRTPRSGLFAAKDAQLLAPASARQRMKVAPDDSPGPDRPGLQNASHLLLATATDRRTRRATTAGRRAAAARRGKCDLTSPPVIRASDPGFVAAPAVAIHSRANQNA